VGGRRTIAFVLAGACILWGCGKGFNHYLDGENIPLASDKDLPPAEPLKPVSSVADAGTPDAGHPPDAGVPRIFQPGFHQALRSVVHTSEVTTFRFKVSVERAGTRVRFAFLAAQEGLILFRANVARAEAQGALVSTPTPITFSRSEGISIPPNQRAWSDPVEFGVARGEQLYVSFEVDGALAASTIGEFPESYAREGSYSQNIQPFGGGEHPRAAGLTTIEVEGEPGLAAVAIGDSITEGYVSSQVASGSAVADGFLVPSDNQRNAWPAIAARILGIPVVNSGISGQGVQDVLDHLPQDVFPLHGITDCFVLIGTNDLWAMNTNQITSRMSTLIDNLRAHCRVWLSTLVPKERTTGGDYEVVRTRRGEVNVWIRGQGRIFDFEQVLRSEADSDHFLPGLGEDGIHPSVLGHEVMGEQAAHVFQALH
jgi:lysophospholipase L1-like esterase